MRLHLSLVHFLYWPAACLQNRWEKGAFAASSEGALTPPNTSNNPATAAAPPAAAILGPGPGSTVLDVLAPKYKALAANTMRHCQGLPAEHALVCGPPGSGKSWLLWEGTLLAGEVYS